MGVLPLQITDDFVSKDAGIGPNDRIDIDVVPQANLIGQSFSATWMRSNGQSQRIAVRAVVETQQEVEQLRSGGILPALLRARLGG